MHLIWENLVKNLVLHWTGDFKGLDSGVELYELPKAIWEVIGESTAASGLTIPSAYGSRVPNIATNRSYCSAEMWSFWTLYIGPVLLRQCFQNQKYYKHFIRLVWLLNICLQFDITDDEIQEIRSGFIQWVRDYERYVVYFCLSNPSAHRQIQYLLSTRCQPYFRMSCNNSRAASYRR